MKKIIMLLVLVCVGSVIAEEQFAKVKLIDLAVTEGTLPSFTRKYVRDFSWYGRWEVIPRVITEPGTEAYLLVPELSWRFEENEDANIYLVIKSGKAHPVTGTVILPGGDDDGGCIAGFSIEPAFSADPGLRKDFYQAKSDHYRKLISKGIPGTAWFRHQKRTADAVLAEGQKKKEEDERSRTIFDRSSDPELEETYALFTGGKAVSENLRLDRRLLVTKEEEQTIDIDSIEGITTAEIDWKPLIKDKNPALDPLAGYIPSDQHVIFMKTFDDMLAIMDEADASGTPVLGLLETRSEDGNTRRKVEVQICLKPDALSRLLGGKMIDSVAFTGSDPYLRTGSDVAVLFETGMSEELLLVISQKHAAAKQTYPDAEMITGELSGISWTGVKTADRRICSYAAAVGKAVAVTNSLAQLELIIQAFNKKIPSIKDLDEYIFFRDRYPIGEGDEKALLVLSDAAIRRWCGPKWRIGASRRTQAAAVLSELQAELSNRVLADESGDLKKIEQLVPGYLGVCSLNRAGVSSGVYGSLEFLTPIRELEITNVTPTEKRIYEEFREMYQDEWRDFFDPIAIRFSLSEKKTGIDVTVRPLVAGSEYRDFMEIVGNKKFTVGDGDPHPGSLIHYIMAFDVNAPDIKEGANMASAMAPNLGVNALSWLGSWVSVYIDDSKFWDGLAQAIKKDGENGMEDFMEKNFMNMPIAIHVDVSNGLKLTAFLVSFRAFVEQSAPGMTVWENLTYKDKPYVKITATEQTRKMISDEVEELAVYYAPTPDSLIITLSEEMLKSSLERRGEKKKEETGNWIGESLALSVRKKANDVIKMLYRESLTEEFQTRAWDNLYILNEWKSMYPDMNPVDVHEKLWKSRLVCPAGGEYVWNDRDKTMESTVFGHPGRPKKPDMLKNRLVDIVSASFGITFEEGGLRAAAEIEKE